MTPLPRALAVRASPGGVAAIAGVLLFAGAVLAAAGYLTRSPAPVPPAVGIAAATASVAASPSPRHGDGATWHVNQAVRAPGATAAPALDLAHAPPAPPMSFAVPVRLSVPAIGVSASVISLGENPDGTAAVPPLTTPQLTSWFDAGPAPGQAGPAAIYGHVDTAAAGPAVFFRLGDLTPGDTIDITRADRSVAVFTVYRIAEYAKNAFPTMTVYGDTPDAELRLITCGGDFDPATGSYLDNIVAYARLTSARP